MSIFWDVLIFSKSEPEQPADQDQEQAEDLVPGNAAEAKHFTGIVVAQELQKKTDQAVVDQVERKDLPRETALAPEQDQECKVGETQQRFVELHGMQRDAGQGMGAAAQAGEKYAPGKGGGNAVAAARAQATQAADGVPESGADDRYVP